MIEMTGTNSTFLKIIEPLLVLNDEVKLVFDKDRMYCRVVDPAHVSMVEVRASRKHFDSYKCDNHQEFGIEIDILKRFLNRPSFRKTKHNTKLVLDETKGQVQMDSAISSLKIVFDCVDTAGLPEPKWPRFLLNWKCKIVPLSTLFGIITDFNSDNLSDHFRITATKDAFEVYQDTFDDKSQTRYSIPQKQIYLVNRKYHKKDEKTTACYPLEYFTCIMNGLKKAIGHKAEVTIKFGNDYPIELSGGDPNFSVTYLLAPRIESD